MTALQRKWVDTTGGPHLLLPEELLPSWRGIEGWFDHTDIRDTSDYARACRTNSWLGVIPCATGAALVLGGEVGPVAWFPHTGQDGGLLVQWIAADDEKALCAALQSEEMARLLATQAEEEVKFFVEPPGKLRLFDSADLGNDLLGDSIVVELVPGEYSVRAAYFRLDRVWIVVRQIQRD